MKIENIGCQSSFEKIKSFDFSQKSKPMDNMIYLDYTWQKKKSTLFFLPINVPASNVPY
jgi:hypothetical protein